MKKQKSNNKVSPPSFNKMAHHLRTNDQYKSKIIPNKKRRRLLAKCRRKDINLDNPD